MIKLGRLLLPGFLVRTITKRKPGRAARKRGKPRIAAPRRQVA